MAKNTTGDDGTFLLNVRVDEIPKIIPVLKATHDCNNDLPGKRIFKLTLPDKYIKKDNGTANTLNIGVWNLEVMPDAETEPDSKTSNTVWQICLITLNLTPYNRPFCCMTYDNYKHYANYILYNNNYAQQLLMHETTLLQFVWIKFLSVEELQ